MRQRGRRSAAERLAEISAVDVRHIPLQPPETLNDAERTIFLALVNAVDPKHFAPSDLPLVTAYVQAVAITQATAHDPERFREWTQAAKLMAVLATRLRLAPQSRHDSRAAARHQLERTGPWPWEDR
jgi:hypothetical protein